MPLESVGFQSISVGFAVLDWIGLDWKGWGKGKGLGLMIRVKN